MAIIYDNWERLVRATLRREELRLSAQRTPSDLSSLSASSSFSFSSSSNGVSSFNFLSLLVGDPFPYDEILEATNWLDESNYIKDGYHGGLFYGVLQCGTQILVEKIDLSSITKLSYFMSELEIFSNVCRSRYIPLGHCLENGKDKFLVYKYIPHGDLSKSLHRKIAGDNDNHLPPLDWKTRLKIALNSVHKKIVLNNNNQLPPLDWKIRLKIIVKITGGAAEGLHNLHHEHVLPLVDSPIFDDNYEVQLERRTEFSMEVNDRNPNRIARFLQLPKYQLIGVNERSLGENCKLLEMFEDVDLVIFCVSLTDYNEFYVDTEGVRINKMLASRKLMENIVAHPTFTDKNFLLVLNKFHLLKEKVAQVPLTQCDWFQDFNPVCHQYRRNDYSTLAQSALHYIALKFKRLFSSITERKLYVSPITEIEDDCLNEALKYGGEVLKWEEEERSACLTESSYESSGSSTSS